MTHQAGDEDDIAGRGVGGGGGERGAQWSDLPPIGSYVKRRLMSRWRSAFGISS
jgi:hypothetical protein